jgi:hypothetical protein
MGQVRYRRGVSQRIPLRIGRIPPLVRHDRAHLHHFEIRSRDRLQRAQLVIVPARIGGTADVPVRTVIGNDHVPNNTNR